MPIQPLGNRVLIRLAKEEEVTKFGIVLPENADKEKKTEGEVIAVGPGKMTDSGTVLSISVKAGDKVLVKSWGGDEVHVDGEDYKIFDADEILGIIA
ncbi:MAG: co-chaperone GroES [Candidatus Magasanikbacteria bacterium]